MTPDNSLIQEAITRWLADSAVPVTSAAYHLSDKAALALSAGYLSPELRNKLYVRLQKGSTTPRVGNVEELRGISANAAEWHAAAKEAPTAALHKRGPISAEGRLLANDVKSALAHRNYRRYMGTLGSRRRAFISDGAFAITWMGIREERRNGIFLNAQQRNELFDALCRSAAPVGIDYAGTVGPRKDGYRFRTFSEVALPEWANVNANENPSEDYPQLAQNGETTKMVTAGEENQDTERDLDSDSRDEAANGALEAVWARVPKSIKGEAGTLQKTLNGAVSLVSKAIAGRAVGDESWVSSREQLRRVQAGTLKFVDSYDTGLYMLGIVMDRLDRSAAWNGEALAVQAASIDITAEVMEIAADICELRDVSTALRKKGAEHGVHHQRRLRELGGVWDELVDRIVALVALADAVNTVDTELVRWSDYRSVDNIDERIDNLVARSGFRMTSRAHDDSIREDIAESGRIMATARSVIEQEIGALGRS